MVAATAELPDPEDRGPKLNRDSFRGTNEPMEAHDPEVYTVDDEFRISWLDHHLRNDRVFKSVRDLIKDNELDDQLARYVSQYFSYLLHKEHGVTLEDTLDHKFSATTNHGKNRAYVTLKAVA